MVPEAPEEAEEAPEAVPATAIKARPRKPECAGIAVAIIFSRNALTLQKARDRSLLKLQRLEGSLTLRRRQPPRKPRQAAG